MSGDELKRLTFVAEWFQEEAGIVRPYTIIFFLNDSSVEVYDQRTKKLFLRRTKMDQLQSRDFYIGSKINIFGRQFDIVNYGDESTKNILAKYRKNMFLIMKHKAISYLGALVNTFIETGFSVNRAMMAQFLPAQVTEFLNSRAVPDNTNATLLMNELSVGPSVGFEIIGDYAFETIKYCIGDDENFRYDGQVPPALKDFFAQKDVQGGFFCSNVEESVQSDIAYFFDYKNELQANCILENTTLCIIKPHAIKEGNLGKILKEIMTNGFTVTALSMHLMERANSEEFYEVYRGVLPEYISMVGQLSSGKIMCLEVTCNDKSKNSYEEFRTLCGPMDPEIAKLLRPHTLRAKFGTTRTNNAVHCTDLPEDTILELQYMFKVMK